MESDKSDLLYETIVKSVFDLKCKRYLDEQNERFDLIDNLQLEFQLEQAGYEKNLIEKQSEFVNFKKEIYEELIEKFKKQNQLLNRVEYSLKTKTKILLNEKLEHLQSELQRCTKFFATQDMILEREQAKMLKFMEENFNQNEMKNVWNFVIKFDALIESETNNFQAKFNKNSFWNPPDNSQFQSQFSNYSAGFCNQANILNDSRYNSQSKRETCIIKPLASLDSDEVIPPSKVENNNEKVKEKRAEEGTEMKKAVLTTEIVEVIDKPPIENKIPEADSFKMSEPKPIEKEVLQVKPNSPVAKKARFELPFGKNDQKNTAYGKNLKFDESFSASFNFKFGGSDANDVSKEKGAGFFMMADEEDNTGFNESFHFAF